MIDPSGNISVEAEPVPIPTVQPVPFPISLVGAGGNISISPSNNIPDLEGGILSSPYNSIPSMVFLQDTRAGEAVPEGRTASRNIINVHSIASNKLLIEAILGLEIDFGSVSKRFTGPVSGPS